MSTDDLPTAVRERREQLGMSQQDLADRTKQLDGRQDAAFPGLSLKSIGDIERGVRDGLRPHTRQLLDEALEWPSGTTDALLKGKEPPEAPPLDEQQMRRLRYLEQEVARLRSAVLALIDAVAAPGRLVEAREELLRNQSERDDLDT